MSAQGRFRFVAGPELGGYELAPDHPFKPVRFELTSSLLTASGLLAQGEVIPAAALPRDALLEVHDRDYVAAAERLSVPGSVATPEDAARFGLGTPDNPVFPGMHEKVASVCAATATAVELVASGSARRAASFAGGLHHALRGRASGFCVYNDLAIAIKRAVERHGVKVAYLDVDAHHGDGVQDAFAADERVHTVSIHEAGRWPGTGAASDTGDGRACNLPVPPGFNDAELEALLRSVVLPLAGRLGPQAVVITCGADALAGDPLSRMALSNVALWSAAERLAATAPAAVVLGGGGYNPWTVARYWTGLWGVLTKREIPRRLPPSAREILTPLTCDLVDDEDFQHEWLSTLADRPNPGPVRAEVEALMERHHALV